MVSVLHRKDGKIVLDTTDKTPTESLDELPPALRAIDYVR